MTTTAAPSELPFTIPELERAASQRDFGTVFDKLRELLLYMNKGLPVIQKRTRLEDGRIQIVKGGLAPLHSLMPYEEKLDWVNRLATVITAYLSDREYKHSNPELTFLVLFKTNLSELFYISSYGSMDHILFNRGLLNENFHLQLQTAEDINMLLVCLTLQSRIKVDYEMLMDISDLGYLAYLALFYDFEHPFGHKALENFHEAIACKSRLLAKVNASDDHHIELMLNPWMGCSYWDIEDRHHLKFAFNQVIQQWLEHKLPPGLKKRMAANAARKGPVKRIVVASEKYISAHAVYRCYHPRIEALRDHFELILVTTATDYDKTSAQDFDQVIEVADAAHAIADTVKEVAKLEPDMIFFPSLGMAKWTILLANLRIARYQVMAYGHPASAFSHHIDYGMCDQLTNTSDYQSFFVERLIPVLNNPISFTPHPNYHAELKRTPVKDGVVRIAINSSLAKISPRILNLCQILLAHSSVPLEFHFFLVHNRSWKNLAFEKWVKQKLGIHAVVHSPAPYEQYMTNLGKCDLGLGTFPFGGSNTNVDLLLLGIPKIIYLEGSDLASFTDYYIMKCFELPDILICRSEAELLASAIYLIHNEPERERISQSILEQNPAKRLFSTAIPEEKDRLSAPIRWVAEQAPYGTVE